MTVKVTQLTLTAMIKPATDDYSIRVSNVFVEVLGDAPPDTIPPSSEFGPQDFVGLSPGGLDVHFEIPSLSAGQSVTLRTNAIIDQTKTTVEPIQLVDDGSLVTIENRAGVCWIAYYRSPGQELKEERRISWVNMSEPCKVRINYHENHITVYLNGTWGHTHSGPKFTYLDPLEIYIKASQNVTLEDVVVTELHDWRHGIFTETEADGASILSSIIQERPVEIYVKSDGTLVVFYNVNPTPRDIAGVVRAVNTRAEYNAQAGSDLILYYRDIATIVDANYLEDSGFITKVLRLSGLDNGAAFAGRIIARRAREREQSFRVTMRPDFSIESGDVVTLDIVESGVETVITKNIFIESVQLQIGPGAASMVAQGRLHDP